jgi:hypothetical protein
LGFVVIGLMVIGLIALTAFSSAMMSSMSSSFGAGGGVFMTIIWAIMVAVYWYPTLMLYKFSKSMKEGLTYNNQAMIDDGFRYQKNMWKFTGILMIVIISFYVLAILAAIVGISR